MKKFLIAASALAVMSVATGYAQQDPLQDWRAKTATSQALRDAQAYQAGADDRAATMSSEELQYLSKMQQAGPDKPAKDPFADMVIAKSQIKSVTIYNNRAKVTRVAEVDIPAGAHTVAFQDLPAILLPDSLQASGSAPEAVKFGAISSKQIMEDHLTSPRERELYDKIQSLRDQRQPLLAEKSALQAQGDFLKNIGQQATMRNNENLAQIDLKPEQWTAAAQAIYNGTADVLKATAQQDQKLRDIDREIDKAQREFAQAATGQKSIFAVLVPLDAEKPTHLKIEISYQVPNATWQPIYDARMTTQGKSEMHLTQYGSVRQQTGEDWTGVALTLSTAQPQRGTSLPDLQPMWINGYEPRTESFFGSEDVNISRVAGGSDTRQTVGAVVNDPEYVRKLQQQNRSLAEQAAASGGSFVPTPIAPAENQTLSLPVPKAAVFVPAQINTGGFVSEYKIPGPANVPSDGTETKLLIGNFDVESALQVHIKPQLSTAAYLVVHAKLKGDAPILPGQVNLFRDEAYVGQNSIPLLRPDEEYDLYFGIDDQVSVKRNVLKDEIKHQGVIAKDKILERNYVTELQNLHDIPVDVIVKETTPASQNEKITVDINKETTTPGFIADADNIKGLLNWKFKMDPKEKKELKLDWTVSWPSDYAVTGL